MKIRKLLFPLALATLGIGSVPATANALSFTPRPDLTDTSFNQLIASGEFTEVFVAQGRIGNNAVGGTQEFDLLDASNNLLPVAQGQRVWNMGEPVDFVLEYTGSAVNYILGGELLSSTIFSGPFTDIFLRTRAATNTIMVLSDLFLDGVEIPGLISASLSPESDIDYLQIKDLPETFRLTGKAEMVWAGDPPANSALAYQIKVGTSRPVDVPEPGTVLALTLGAGALVLKKRKHSPTSDSSS